MAKKKVISKKERSTLSESDFQKYVDELYDHGLDSREVEETLRYGQLQRRTNPTDRDYDNQYVWTTSDRLDRALSLANRRLNVIRDYEERMKQVQHLMDMIRMQIGMFGTQENAKTLILATRAYLDTPISPWSDPIVTSSHVMCAVCECQQCKDRINGASNTCCGHKDDVGSWGLPF